MQRTVQWRATGRPIMLTLFSLVADSAKLMDDHMRQEQSS